MRRASPVRLGPTVDDGASQRRKPTRVELLAAGAAGRNRTQGAAFGSEQRLARRSAVPRVEEARLGVQRLPKKKPPGPSGESRHGADVIERSRRGQPFSGLMMRRHRLVVLIICVGLSLCNTECHLLKVLTGNASDVLE
jgi:hypothetical protein